MSLDQYLAEQTSEGDHDSEGVFTLDFSKAADRLAQFRLPSPHHYLLKVIQIASQLGATDMTFRMERFRTAVHFRTPEAGTVADSEAIYTAFADPLKVDDSLMSDLVGALLGCLGNDTVEVLWSYSKGHRGRRVFIKDHQFEARDFILSRPLEADDFPCAFTLSVLHPRTWKFWKAAPRIAEAIKLVEDLARYSRVSIKLDGRRLSAASSNSYVHHRKTQLHPFEVGVAATFTPYRVASYLLSNDQDGFRLRRPGTANYVVRERDINVWASGTRLRNTLKPDGVSSPAWLLQFSDGDANISMRQVPKTPVCRALLAFHPQDVNQFPLRLTVVRNSVIVLSEDVETWSDQLPFLRGCTVILHDQDLPTDLTGFQIIQDMEFQARLEALKPLFEGAKRFVERGSKIVNFVD